MTTIAVFAHTFNVLVFFLYDKSTFGSEHFFVQKDLLVKSSFDGGCGVERFELLEFFVVEVDCAMFWPGDFVLVFLV